MKGRVKRVTRGVFDTEVVNGRTEGVEVVSIITRESAERLGLSEGKEVYAVIKASDVMVATD